ncbi:MAG TPA: response regulator transcription factor [Nitrospira sp.]|nr:response regulator transcription factor [Nitrospira sp.]
MAKPRILLADDHLELLDALRDLVAELGEVVGTVRDGQSLVEAAQWLKPDIIFTDISMPKLNGLDATRAILVRAPQSKVIILSSYQEPAYVSMAFNAGARGYVLKRTALCAELSQALMHVLAGDHYIGLGVKAEWAPGHDAPSPELPPTGTSTGWLKRLQ